MLSIIVPSSTASNTLYLADPGWARGMAQAMRWMAIYLVVSVGIAIMGTAVGFVLELAKDTSTAKAGSPAVRYHDAILVFHKIFAVGMGFVGLGMAGALAFIADRAIRKDPRSKAHDPLDFLRSITRPIFFVLAFAVLLDFLVQIYAAFYDGSGKDPSVLAVTFLCRVPSMTAVGTLLFIIARFLNQVISRGGVASMASQAARVTWYCLALGVSTVFMFVWIGLTTALSLALKEPGVMALNCMVCLLLPIMLIAALLFVIEGLICYFRAAGMVERSVS